MHLIDLSVDFLGCVPIVGSTIPIGVGAAFGALLQDRVPLTVIFFGDAAAEIRRFSRERQLRGRAQAADAVRLREQPLFGEHPARRAPAGGPRRSPNWPAASAQESRHDGQDWSRRSCGGRRDDRADPRQGRPGAPRVHHLPLARALRAARRPPARVPHAGRSSTPGSRAVRSGSQRKLLLADGVHRRGRASPRSMPRSPPRSTTRWRSRSAARFRRARSSAGTCSPDRSRSWETASSNSPRRSTRRSASASSVIRASI